MVRVPGGTFWMDSKDGDPDEQPVHEVTVSTFELDVSEVTVGKHRACVRDGVRESPRSAEGGVFRGRA